MRSLFPLSTLTVISILGLSGCGSDSQETANVSFSVADAPVDNMKAVWVTLESVTLESDSKKSKTQTIMITDKNGKNSPMYINLMDYQNGDTKLIIENAVIAKGSYRLVLNTYGCAQSANGTGSTDYCSVVKYDDSIYPLKTPSNKLKLGEFYVSKKDYQAYTLEFKLRSALVNNGGGSNYNLKPHGVSIVESAAVGSISGTVDMNLYGAGDCPTDSGNVVYLYQGWHSTDGALDMTLGDEYDPSVDTDVPENVLMPYASKLLDQDNGDYTFAYLPAGDYTLAFSCNDVGVNQNELTGDDPEYYDQIPIGNPTYTWGEVTVSSGNNTTYDFNE
ncbi:DUF4382 domain-containing protein [Photobacterium sp. SDRW27]|uniref:DUF4382 domain-containing protein n=1 Tax=Photobacterium obscurum TaxID=2829490 RepID=UPI0022442AF8|nr:DUF4382 domain-containing protein [Photobacterium obscurum]MCW8330173.1 DUF4382 domain-containing protein [Photobacterium obscurum]